MRHGFTQHCLLRVRVPGEKAVPWLGSFENLAPPRDFDVSPYGGAADGDRSSPFPVKTDCQPSYASVPTTAWNRETAAQTDVHRVLRLAKKLPDKAPAFYKVTAVTWSLPRFFLLSSPRWRSVPRAPVTVHVTHPPLAHRSCSVRPQASARCPNIRQQLVRLVLLLVGLRAARGMWQRREATNWKAAVSVAAFSGATRVRARPVAPSRRVVSHFVYFS